MKKLAMLLGALLCVGALAGCGNGIPDDMSKDAYDLGCKALETVDAFLDADISAQSAKSKLDLIDTQMEDFDFNGEYFMDAILRGYVSPLSYYVGRGDRKELLQKRNSLAEKLGKTQK